MYVILYYIYVTRITLNGVKTRCAAAADADSTSAAAFAYIILGMYIDYNTIYMYAVHISSYGDRPIM